MGVQISGQERGLKKHQAGGPHRRRAAEPGQNQLRENRLDQEKKESAKENGGAVKAINRDGARRPARTWHMPILEERLLGHHGLWRELQLAASASAGVRSDRTK